MKRLLCAALLLSLLLSGCAGEENAPPTAREMSEEVIVCGGQSVSNTELNYYFWSEYFYLTGNGAPESLDPDKPLAGQAYDESQTWQDYILAQAVDTVRSTVAMAGAAGAEGFFLPEDYRQSLEAVLDDFSDYAREAGFLTEDGQADVEAYLKDSYGPAATEESFRAYLEKSYLAAAWSDALYAAPTFTEEEISAHYDRYAGDYEADGIPKDDARPPVIRLLHISPADDGDEAWEEARSSAETLLATWKAESGAEEDFAALAETHSDDPSAADGGLLAGVWPTDLTGALRDWVFGGRAEGDTAVLRDDSGWAAVYFAGWEDGVLWQQAAEHDLRRETYQEEFRRLVEACELTIDRGKLRIFTPAGLYG